MAPIATTACRIVGSNILICTTFFSQKSGEKAPVKLGPVAVAKKYRSRCSAGSIDVVGLHFGADAVRCVTAVVALPACLGGPYPSHFLPVEVQRLQNGFSSPHFTLRILVFYISQKPIVLCLPFVSQIKGVQEDSLAC